MHDRAGVAILSSIIAKLTLLFAGAGREDALARARAEALLADRPRLSALRAVDAEAREVVGDRAALAHINAVRGYVNALDPKPRRADTATRMLYRDGE